MTPARTCRVCGCNDHAACFDPEKGFCRWADEKCTLCSHCMDRQGEKAAKREAKKGGRSK